jgi:ribosomal peptide maturation radical SAM protein 1
MKIALVSVPFLSPQYPGLGLTQIKGRLNKVFEKNVEVRLVYANHDFFQYVGAELYGMISESGFAPLMNEWAFRSEAFDRIKPNHEEYFKRFYPGVSANSPEIAYLREKLLNLGTFIQQVISTYCLDSYDVIGINATFEIVPALAFCRHLKQINQKIITVMGGAALFKDAAETLIQHYPYLDYVCSGSGLVSFPKLVRGILDNNETAGESVAGMFSHSNTGKPGHVSEELDINEDIFLDYDDFFESFFRFHLDQQMEPIILMETSRGCFWCSCTFCGLNKDQMKYRVKRPKIAVEEINHYFKKYNCNIEMVDNVMPRSYIKHVLPYLRVPEGKMLLYEVMGDYKEEEMRALNRAKVKMIQPGIESLSTPVLELMNKGTNAFQCLNMLKYCVKYGVLPGWNLLIGFPQMTGDMYERLLSILPRVFHLFPPGILNPVRIDRYSTYWQNSEKYNLVLAPFTAYEYIYPYDHEVLAKIAYHFEDRNYGSERYYLLSEYLPGLQERLNDWKRRWQTKDVEHFPRLTLRPGNDGTYIFDSRQDVKEYKISSLEAKMLNVLEMPLSKDSIITHFPGETGERIDEILQRLDGNALLFNENDRYLSLVIHDYSEDEIKFIVETCNYQL